MPRLGLIVVLCCWMFGTGEVLRAESPATLIRKAIQAYGGETSLAKLKIVRAKARGTVNIGAEVPFRSELVWQAPQQFKLQAELDAAGKKVLLVEAFDGSQGWAAANGVAVGLSGPKLDDLKAQMHVRHVLSLTPLLADNRLELAALEPVSIQDRKARGVLVKAAGQRDVKLYFDNETSLLVKLERMVWDDSKKQLANQEDFYTQFQDVAGVKTAMKEVWMRSGVKVAELEYIEVTYPTKIEPREFQSPAGGIVAGPSWIRTADVVYGRKFGMALTLDVFSPKTNANGAAVILVISGGWVSDNNALNNPLMASFIAEPIRRGYTVFAVFHGSQPKYTIPEAISDLNRAVRFIRHHASDYQIDPARIGIMGSSAGGHLSLMQGTAGDIGNAAASDPVERESSRVQAVACLFPPTDFLNYGEEGKSAFGPGGLLAPYRAVVDVREFDVKTSLLERTVDPKKHLELAMKISPRTHVSAEDPPTLIIHGDKDVLVPIQQGQLMITSLKEAGVKAELLTRPGRGHDFAGVDKDILALNDWFDRYLKK